MKVSEIHRILYIRTDRFGDLLMNVPAIRLLRQTYPKAWITLLADQSVADLLKHQPDLDEIMTISSASFQSKITERLKVFRRIKKAKFDMVLIANPDKHFHLMSFFAKIPFRIGHRRKWSFFLNRVFPKNPAVERHEIEKNLDLVKLVSDRVWDEVFFVEPGPDARSSANLIERNYFTLPGNVVALHTGSSRREKMWPAEKFGELAGRIQKNGYIPAFVGSKEEREKTENIIRAFSLQAVNLTGVTDLPSLTAFFMLPRVKALVTSDSGPMHSAWMNGLPVVALFAKNFQGSNPKRWGPRNSRSITLYKNMDEITTEEVWQALHHILSQNPEKSAS